MPPVVCFIRHAQALHNIDTSRLSHLTDPRLSKKGLEQCKDLRDHLKQAQWMEDVQLIVTSPMRRTVETMSLSLDWLIQKGVPVIPHAIWQENSAKPCDTGTDVAKISQEFPEFDFSSVDPLYPQKSGRYAYTLEAVVQRGRDALAWLKARPEKCIVVVTHSAFLRTSVAHRRFSNADYRLFRFAEEGEGEQDSELVELELTSRAGGMGKSPIGWKGIEAGDFNDTL